MYYEDSVIEQSAVQKLLLNLLPLLCLLAMVNVLDRLDLSWAAPDMNPTLHLNSDQIHGAYNAFHIGFVLTSLPAALLMLKLGARRWLGWIVIAWGVVSMAHAAIWNDASLYTFRILLGITEASLMPATVFYLTEWMPERHRALPIAAVVAAASLVPVVGEAGSNLLLRLPVWLGITDWRWMFLVEGVPAVWLGLHVLEALPPTPPVAPWLPHPERHWLVNQLREAGRLHKPGRFIDGLRTMANWKLAAARLVVGMVASSLGMWVPFAMQQNGYLPTDIGTAIMAGASVIGAMGALAAGVRGVSEIRLRWALAALLVLVGLCLGCAALLSSGVAAVLLLAVVACLVPGIVALTWVLAPYLLAGAAAACGFSVLAAAGSLGDLLAGQLDAIRHDAGTRCVVLAVACFAAAVLAATMDGRRKTGAAAAAAGQ